MGYILKLFTLAIAIAFGAVSIGLADTTHPGTGTLSLPAPDRILAVSPPFTPPVLKGIKVYPENPFKFEFILDRGDEAAATSVLPKTMNGEPSKQEAARLIRYFLTSLTVPEKDLWVNLSPYEHDRIIPQAFGTTEMGRDLLAEDYILKQITASFMSPQGETGKEFWRKIYAKVAKRYGSTQVRVNTFNKVWIVPEKAVVYENATAGTAYVVESKLKVMLEADYLARRQAGRMPVSQPIIDTLRQVIIPELTKEINEGRNFAQLRQIHNSLILAQWYRKKIRDSILAAVYENQNKTSGLRYASQAQNVGAANDIENIYQHYLQAFKKGAYNFIQEQTDPDTRQTVARKYFSGGMNLTAGDAAMTSILPTLPSTPLTRVMVELKDSAMVSSVDDGQAKRDAQNALRQANRFLRPSGQFGPTYFQRQLLLIWDLNQSVLRNIKQGAFRSGWDEAVKQQVRAFAAALDQEWAGQNLQAPYGSVYPWVILNIEATRERELRKVRLMHEWAYNVLESADLATQVKGLGLVIANNVFHLGSAGMHPERENDELTQNDLDLVLGNFGHVGALARLFWIVKPLQDQGVWEENVGIVTRDAGSGAVTHKSVMLKHLVLWLIVKGLDAGAHISSKVASGYEAQVRELLNGLNPEEYREQSMKRYYAQFLRDVERKDGYTREFVEGLIGEAMRVPPETWHECGLIAPEEINPRRIYADDFERNFSSDAFLNFILWPSTDAYPAETVKRNRDLSLGAWQKLGILPSPNDDLSASADAAMTTAPDMTVNVEDTNTPGYVQNLLLQDDFGLMRQLFLLADGRKLDGWMSNVLEPFKDAIVGGNASLKERVRRLEEMVARIQEEGRPGMGREAAEVDGLARILSEDRGRSAFYVGKAYGMEMAYGVLRAREKLLKEGASVPHQEILYDILLSRLMAARQLGHKNGDQTEIYHAILDGVDKIRRGQGRSHPWTRAYQGDRKYNGLYWKIWQRLFEQHPTAELTVNYPIGRTEEVYQQRIEDQSNGWSRKFIVYNAPSALWPAILEHLDELWGKMMAEPAGPALYRLIAEYEWWSFEGNIFGRAGAALGDAMSTVLQLVKGIPLRDGFVHQDFDALSMTLPQYIEARSQELTLRVQHAAPDDGHERAEGVTADSRTGGIDLSSSEALSVQNGGGGFSYHLDPAMIQKWKNSPGFTPVIRDARVLLDLHSWLTAK